MINTSCVVGNYIFNRSFRLPAVIRIYDVTQAQLNWSLIRPGGLGMIFKQRGPEKHFSNVSKCYHFHCPIFQVRNFHQ